MTDQSSTGESGTASPVIIKKYANRRLYNTATSSYVTLEHLAQMVKDGIDFTVHDAKSGDDITRSVLTQIIVEEEAKGQNLLPISFLRRLIALYGDSLQGLVPQYLDVTMRSFSDNQENIRKYLNDAFGGMSPFNQFEEMSRQNMQIFEQAVNMFSPARSGPTASPPPGAPAEATPKPESADQVDADDPALDAMKNQLHAMQRQLDALSRKKDD